jgi:hypothetical protein
MPYVFFKVKMKKNHDYIRYFQRRWNEKESFINCEHDTVFWPGAIEELKNCPEEWCAFGVIHADNRGKALSLTTEFVDGGTPHLALAKFDESFIKKYPKLWDNMTGNWDECDKWLCDYTMKENQICHQHYPPIVNENPERQVVYVQDINYPFKCVKNNED